MAKFTDSSAVTEYDAGLALSAIEKNPSIDGTLAQKTEQLYDFVRPLRNQYLRIYLSDNGNDSTGELFNVNKPFRTLRGAIDKIGWCPSLVIEVQENYTVPDPTVGLSLWSMQIIFVLRGVSCEIPAFSLANGSINITSETGPGAIKLVNKIGIYNTAVAIGGYYSIAIKDSEHYFINGNNSNANTGVLQLALTRVQNEMTGDHAIFGIDPAYPVPYIVLATINYDYSNLNNVVKNIRNGKLLIPHRISETNAAYGYTFGEN